MAKNRSDRKDFLFEIGTEEIPAGMLKSGMSQMTEILKQKLNEYNLTYDDIKGYCTPRRLGCLVKNLLPVQPDETKVVVGPPVKAAYDANGNPTKAAEGFARSQGVEVGSLSRANTGRGECVTAEKHVKGRNYKEFLPDAIGAVFSGLQFRKTMRWSSCDERFIRPVHWLLAIYGNEVVDASFAGVRSGNFTMGHRFAGNRKIILKKPGDYVKKLMACFVVPDYEERRSAVLRAIGEIEAANGFKVAVDDELIES
ncbi:MAG: glycine--tRNA ligase subunit beta, partial [Deltaproteobacteria bacterium]|nr:glycine--tRNA ligase subunit beta [Deltaproteobacteria bacterium]